MFSRRWLRLTVGLLGAVLVGAAALVGPLQAQVISGRLIDESTEAPVTTATILLLGSDSARVDAATTDSVGNFTLESTEEGEFRLLARRIGYPETISTPLALGSGDTIRVEFLISAAAVLLDPVVVQSRRRPPPADIAAFYDRAERSIGGTFITRSEIEEAHPILASDLLRRVPGVQVGPVYYGAASITIRGCVPLFIVDGTIARYERSIDNLVTPLDLEGLEVYRSPAEVPVQYGGLRHNCGAVLIWTRRGP